MAVAESAKRPDVLLFDLGGVLVDSDLFDRLGALLPVAVPIDELKSRWLQSSAVRSFEKGLCSPAAFASSLVDEWHLSVGPAAFVEAFASWPKGFYPGAAAFLSKLRTRFQVACLSNSNAVHWERFGGFREHFEIPLSSHLLGEVKPDAACFVLALQHCRAEAPAVAFFDDSLDNVAAARALGMQAFHADGLEAVKRIVAAQGWS